MTLKLPTPLPYDVVDELIDAEIEFYDETADDLIYWYAQRRNYNYQEGIPLTSTFTRQMFDVFDDISAREKEDEQGYVVCTFLPEGMVWTAKELTDKEIDHILALETG